MTEGDRASNWEQLKEDGKTGEHTRKQLMGDYMNYQGTTLPDDVDMTTHGCGEYFPLNAEGTDVDPDAADGEDVQGDRRVELLFFDKDLGTKPPPPGDMSKQGSEAYPEWRRADLRRHARIRRPDGRAIEKILWKLNTN